MILKFVLLFLLLLSNVFADSKKVYFYITESDINDFKSLKISFDKYLDKYNYEFQAFNKKSTFESYLTHKDIIVILSSWHYKQIAKKYDLHAKLVASKRNTITDTKVIVGKKNSTFSGTITSAYSKDYSLKLIPKLIKNNNLNVLNVPKEIDALMSVGFGMSDFALVSKDSFELLKEINPFLTKQMTIYKESSPSFRMFVSSKLDGFEKKDLINIFTNMKSQDDGRKVLDMLRIDDMVVLTRKDLLQLGGEK